MVDLTTQQSDEAGHAPVRSSVLAALQYRAAGKRVFDLILALLMLPILGPVVCALCLLVRRDGAHPLFGHERVGMQGKRFRCWKIRTMVADADARLAQLLENDPAARLEWDRDHKLTNDPRITPLGSFLRKTSLDELPQIWNVIRGEMSFVGPRPVTRPELAKYGEHLGHYLSVRPGVTGLWQVSGRNNLSYPERVRLDVDYCRRLSFPLDFQVLAKTAETVLRQTGR